jgi:uncharacterized membrane protein YphA (DoxX/SURF4 family)
MKNLHLFAIGRIFFTICIIGIGVMHFFYPGIRPSILPGLSNAPSVIGYLTGIVLIIIGVLVSFGKKFSTLSLFMGIVCLALFLFGHLPPFLSTGPMNSSPWVKMNKMLAFAGGFLLIAATEAPQRHENKC